MGRRTRSKDHNCQSEHDTQADRPHCDPRTTHYENRAGVSLVVVATHARIPRDLHLPHPKGIVLHLYFRMISLALLSRNTKQHMRPLILQFNHAVCRRGSPFSVLGCIRMFTLGLGLFARWQIECGGCQGEAVLQALVLTASVSTWHTGIIQQLQLQHIR